MKKSPEIILIDDDPEIAIWVNKIIDLRSIPNIIRTSQNYVDAMELLFPSRNKRERFYPKLILLEIEVSNNKGLTLLQSIKKHPELKKIPILVLSNSSNEEFIKKCYNLHVNAYLKKPPSFEEFTQLFNIVLKLWLEIITLPEIRGVEIK